MKAYYEHANITLYHTDFRLLVAEMALELTAKRCEQEVLQFT